MTVALAITAAACYILAGTKVVALFADRFRSLVLREYAISVASIAVVFTLLLPPVIAVIDQLSANLALLLNSLVGIVCLTSGQTILVASAGTPTQAASRGETGDLDRNRRIVRRWWTACLLIVVVRAALFIAAPSTVHTVEMVDFAPNYARYPTLAAFYLVRIVWFGLIFTNIWRGYRAYARQESSEATRWGLSLHSWAGMLGLGYVAYQLVYVGAQWLGHPLPGEERRVGSLILLSVVSTLLFATMILYLGPTLQARHTHRALQPLWLVVAAGRVGAVLDDRRFSATERVIRRRQENADGLARLRGYYDLSLWQDAYRTAREAGRSNPAAEMIANASTIVAARRAMQDSDPPDDRAPRRLPLGSREADIDWQIALGRALKDPIVTGGAVGVSRRPPVPEPGNR